jgi:transposase
MTMPTAYGAEFRQGVIDAARKGAAPLAQPAKDFGLSVTMWKRLGNSRQSNMKRTTGPRS